MLGLLAGGNLNGCHGLVVKGYTDFHRSVVAFAAAGIGACGKCQLPGRCRSLAFGLADGIGHSLFHCIRGNGGSGHGIDFPGLGIQHRLLQRLKCRASHIGRLILAFDLHIGDLAFVHRKGDGNRTAEALLGSRIASCGVQCFRCCRGGIRFLGPVSRSRSGGRRTAGAGCHGNRSHDTRSR